MRRFALAALSAALVLAACSDQSQSPTEPDVQPPNEHFGTRCTVTRFPLPLALSQIKTVFPTARLKLEASLRAGAIALLWNTCHDKLAQRAALEFVKWMGRQTLPTTEAAKTAQNNLIVTILTGVGLLNLPSTATGGPDFGIGFYDPTKTTDQFFSTAGGTAAAKLPPGAFSEFTVIVISRRPDGSDPLDFEGDQFPPFFDYNAINASGNHFFETGLATNAFCQLPQTEGFQYPVFAEIKIGHNKPTVPVEFELLDPEAVPADLAPLLHCENLLPKLALGNFGGLQSFAHATSRYLTPIARALFMPTPLQAATTAVGFSGPIAHKIGSYSPTGIVRVSDENPYHLEFAPNGDPGEGSIRSFEEGQPITWSCGIECTTYPTVRVVDASGLGVGGVNVIVTLVPQEGAGGSFGEGSTTELTTSFGDGDEGTGYAYFSDLAVFLDPESGDDRGLFNLVFSAEGATPLPSGTFEIAVF